MKRRTVKSKLNLMPVMNLVTILIPLLLISAQLAHHAVIDTTLPAIGDRDPDTPKPDLELSLLITGTGITVAGADAVLSEDGHATVSCDGECRGVDSYDLTRLNTVLAEVKDEWPEHSQVMLVPDNRIPYEVIIGVMDAARSDGTRDLFPQVQVAGGAG